LKNKKREIKISSYSFNLTPQRGKPGQKGALKTAKIGRNKQMRYSKQRKGVVHPLQDHHLGKHRH
jgi:hypothetical protein